jgi:chromosome segregation ATPase
MAGIAVQLSSDVVNIIETLNDLSRQLKINEYDFAESFSKDAQSIINSLQGLDVARVSVYHLLEAESITASALRHKLNSHVSKLQSEAAAAVSSARDSNNSRLQSLQDQLSMMSEEAATLLKKHEVMALHNDVLLPELNKLQTKYDGQVKSLNEKILERAEMQIALNESLDILKSIDDKIRSMMAEVAILEENMCKRKDEIYNEKEELIQVIVRRIIHNYYYHYKDISCDNYQEYNMYSCDYYDSVNACVCIGL